MQRIINSVAHQVLGACRCPHCTTHTGNAVRTAGRRTVNAPQRFPYSSTYWLSGVFAVATTFDAVRKARRTEQWDLAIAEKRSQLSYSTVVEEQAVAEHALDGRWQRNEEEQAHTQLDASSKALRGIEGETFQDYDWAALPSTLSLPPRREAADILWSTSDSVLTHHHTPPVSPPSSAKGQVAGVWDTPAFTPLDAYTTSTTQDSECTPLEPTARHAVLEHHSEPAPPAHSKRDKADKHDTSWLESRRRLHTKNDLKLPRPLANVVNPGGTLLDQVKEFEQIPVHTGDAVNQGNLAPESPYLVRYNSARPPWTAKKSETVNIVTNMFQIRLLEEIALGCLTRKYVDIETLPTSVQELLKCTPKELLDEREALTTDWSLCKRLDKYLSGYSPRRPTKLALTRYERHDGTEFTSPTIMNKQLQNLFRATMHKLRDSYALDDTYASERVIPITFHMLADTFDILDSSRFLPDLNTFNILIAGFSDCNLKTMTSAAIRALRRAHLRPSETTVSVILQHYTKWKSETRFQYWTELIEGKHNGLALALGTEMPEDPMKSANLIFKDKALPCEEEKIVQMHARNPKMFSAIIAGTLEFAGIDAALRKCHEMGQNGWGVCMDTLGPLLRDCAERKDMDSGKRFWEMVCRLDSKARSMERGGGHRTPEPIPQHLFAAMLNLCERTDETERRLTIEEHANIVWPGKLATIQQINKPLWRRIGPELDEKGKRALRRLQHPQDTQRHARKAQLTRNYYRLSRSSRLHDFGRDHCQASDLHTTV